MDAPRFCANRTAAIEKILFPLSATTGQMRFPLAVIGTIRLINLVMYSEEDRAKSKVSKLSKRADNFS